MQGKGTDKEVDKGIVDIEERVRRIAESEAAHDEDLGEVAEMVMAARQSPEAFVSGMVRMHNRAINALMGLAVLDGLDCGQPGANSVSKVSRVVTKSARERLRFAESKKGRKAAGALTEDTGGKAEGAAEGIPGATGEASLVKQFAALDKLREPGPDADENEPGVVFVK